MRWGISRTWSWLSEDPMARVPWATAPFVWTAAEIMSFCHVNWMGPGLVTFAAACVAYGKASRKAARSEFLELDGPELAAVYGLPGAWLTLATKFGPLPFIGPPVHDALTFIFALMYGFGPDLAPAPRGDRRPAGTASSSLPREAADRAAAAEAGKPSVLSGAAWPPRSGSRDRSCSRPRRTRTTPRPGRSTCTELAHATAGAGPGVLASSVNCRHTQEVLSGQKTDVLGGWLVPRDRVEVRPHPQYAYYLLVTFYRSERWSAGAEEGMLWHPMAEGELKLRRPLRAAVPAASVDPGPHRHRRRPGDGRADAALAVRRGRGRPPHPGAGPVRGGKSMVLDTLRERITACDDAVLILIN